MKTLAVLLALLGTPAAAQLYEAPNNTIVNGHLAAKNPTGLVPVATLCGAQPDAGSSDLAGTITNVGTSTCTITFSAAFTVAPSCIVSDLTANHAITVAISTAAITITGGTAADKYAWHCTAKAGL